MSTQLRIYEVEPGGLDDVVAFFHDVAALRRQHGFTIEFAAADEARSRFIWSLSHLDWDRAQDEYERDPARATLFARHRLRIRDRDVSMVQQVPHHASSGEGVRAAGAPGQAT